VTTRCIRCQVLTVPAHEDWRPRGGGARDLLPWADPYISSLVRRLEDRYDAEWVEDDCLSDPFTAEAAAHSWSDLDAHADEWPEDAFMPQPLEPTRQRWTMPVFGGFPLLDEDGDAEGAEGQDFR
jgi:hypothetical protein